jgi:hypothetical protein
MALVLYIPTPWPFVTKFEPGQRYAYRAVFASLEQCNNVVGKTLQNNIFLWQFSYSFLPYGSNREFPSRHFFQIGWLQHWLDTLKSVWSSLKQT